MCNWFRQFFQCFLVEFQNWVLQFPTWMKSTLEQGLVGGGTAPGSSVTLTMLYQRPTTDPWLRIWEATWIGAGTPEMLALALLVLVLGVKLRSLAMVFGVGDAVRARAANRNARTGFFIVVFWYPLALLYLFGVNSLLYWVYPADPLETFMTVFFDPLTQIQFTSSALTATIGLIGVGAALLIAFVLVIRMVLIWVYLWVMPLFVAVYYSELPYLDDLARRLAFRFVPLSLIPLVPAVFIRTVDVLFASGSVVPGLPVGVTAVLFLVMAAFGSWKLFRMGAPEVEKGLKIGAGMTAGIALAVTGHPSAGAMAAGGRIVPAAALASREFHTGGSSGGAGGGGDSPSGGSGGGGGDAGTHGPPGGSGGPSGGTVSPDTPPALPPGDPCKNTSGLR